MILVVALGALATRVPRLKSRPMHTDEAVHAGKFHDLLEAGNYEYDPHEYHGPTLNYFTLIPAALTGTTTYAETTEVTLRIVPVAFSVLLILLTVFLVDGLSLATIPIALLAAASPAICFYSRYYIQETLLLCFGFGAIVAGYRYARTKALPWAVVAGAFVGLMHATKETCVIALASMALAWALVVLIGARQGRPLRAAFSGVRPLHLAVALAAAVGVSALFCSSFFSHPRGVLDSYLTYTTYLGRAGGHDTTHIHPWYYYLRMVLFAKYENGPIWTEAAIVLLALVGSVAAFTGKRIANIDPAFVRFAALYSVFMIIIYAAIPYKTPWCMLGFLHGMILLAGVGAVALIAWAAKPVPRAAVIVLLFAMTAHLALQSYRANVTYQSDSRNPYVYAHPTEEIFTLVADIKAYARLRTGQDAVQVAVPGKDYWPLPWYLRDLESVGWYSDLPDTIGPLIVISDKLETPLIRRLYEQTPRDKRRMYLPLLDDPYYIWFRPGVKMQGYVRKDLWDRYQQHPDPNELIGQTSDQPAQQTTTVPRQQ